jgi:lysyl-tRNA synthetase class 1
MAYEDKDGNEQEVRYDDGSVKLDWRLDWPAHWWLQNVAVEAFGQDHASAGGSYDTGVQLMKDVYDGVAPIPVPYEFINRAGDTKKMSASKGTGVSAEEAVKVLPPEVLRYFILMAPPSRRLYFDQADGAIKLVDEFAELSARTDLDEDEKHTLYICTRGNEERTVSRVPFSHLVASYQAALKDVDATIEIMKRTEHAEVVEQDTEIISNELKFIDAWLEKWAPEDVKFTLQEKADAAQYNEQVLAYFKALAGKIEDAPEDADGEWFHKAIYEFKDTSGLEPKALFTNLYEVLINKDSGPRAGWFLSMLPRDWLIARLKLEK